MVKVFMMFTEQVMSHVEIFYINFINCNTNTGPSFKKKPLLVRIMY